MQTDAASPHSPTDGLLPPQISCGKSPECRGQVKGSTVQVLRVKANPGERR
jgi:hypothetical protein